MHFQPVHIPLHSFVFSLLNPVGWTLKYSLFPKWKCAAWVCLSTHSCCHVQAYVPAMPGLQKKIFWDSISLVPAERKPFFHFGSVTKTKHGAKEFQSCVGRKEPQNYELILRCEVMPRKRTHAHTSPPPPKSALFLMLVIYILGSLCLWQLNFHSGARAVCQKRFSNLFCLTLASASWFAVKCVAACWRFSAFLFMTVSPHFPLLCIPPCGNSYALTLFSSSTGEWDTV